MGSVLRYNSLQFVEWKGVSSMTLIACHRVGGGQGVENGFLDGIGGGLEEQIHVVVREHV